MRLVDDAPHRRWVNPPPPLGIKLDPPLVMVSKSAEKVRGSEGACSVCLEYNIGHSASQPSEISLLIGSPHCV